MKKNKLLTLLLISITMCSCGGGNEQDVDEQGRSIIRVFMNGGNNFEGIKKDSIWQKIEEKANVSLKIEGTTHNSDYYTTLNPIINTGVGTDDIPDVIFTVPGTANIGDAYGKWVEQDLFYNIDDLLAEKPGEYPYIEALLTGKQYRNITYGEGAHTLIPYITSNSGWGIYYRTDWLINVGYYTTDENGNKIAKTPKTIDEFAEVLKLFTENDPDKDNKNDTYGMSPYGDTFYLNPLYHAFGVTPDYDLDANNKATYMYLQPEFKNFLSWFNQMYSNGYIDPQFAANKDNMDREKFFEGTTGILITNAEQHVTWIADAFENSNGKGLLTFGDAPVGTKTLGKEGASGFSDWGGWWGGYSILKDCKDPHAALRLFDYLYSPEGSALRSYGIENIHYTIVDNEIVPSVDGRNEEPDNTFNNNKDADGYSVPTGYYKLGSAFTNNLTWSNDLSTVSAKLEPKFMDYSYSDLIQLGIEKNTLCTSKLTNVTGYYASYTTKMNRIEDETNTYAINAIMGTSNLTSDYDAMLTKLEGKTFDWSNVKKMIEEVARNAGIIS